MFSIKPLERLKYCDPDAPKEQLSLVNWHIGGMRMLAELRSTSTGETYFGDLPAGHGLLYPSLMRSSDLRTFGSSNNSWFAKLLVKSFKNKEKKHVAIGIERNNCNLQDAIIVNCIDYQFGHSLLKLFNTAHYFELAKKKDLILLIPSSLRWLCPEGLGEIWSVPISFSDGWKWFARLDEDLHKEVKRFRSVKLDWGLPHPSPSEIDVSQFSGQKPFQIVDWMKGDNPVTVTMIWRDHRVWDAPDILGWRSGVQWRLLNRLGFRPDSRVWQQRAFVEYAEDLHQRIKGLRLAVAGLGRAPAPWPSFIEDRTHSKPDEACERGWIQLYSQSHLVVGMHGSNMLLPTAHAGAAVILMPDEKWRNIAQDSFNRESNPRLYSARNIYIPASTSAAVTAQISCSLLERLPNFELAYVQGSRPSDLLQTHARNLRYQTAEIKHWADSRFR